ncbi:hypothetical protein [Lacicoccus qingdaonensis]|uniref:Uncharacterized protein n=1 Tax=Lacicoccus qingdaonensis TaxID=576118 RepID=A0A1G9EZ29_9BACL|nr:hypothetical protein [Salinicoccus qingdaonensis]SDK81437.1 hypothetical protein SAMN05216216_11059 [Salinicoccus qingdaonensis]
MAYLSLFLIAVAVGLFAGNTPMIVLGAFTFIAGFWVMLRSVNKEDFE